MSNQYKRHIMMLCSVVGYLASVQPMLSAAIAPNTSTNTLSKEELLKEKLKAKKEIAMIKHWQQDKKIASQPFIIESEHEQTSGVLSWDLEKNIWQFQYTNTTWVIKNNELIKKEHGQETSYPCVGFSALLQHKMDTWQEIMEKKHEVCNENVCFLFVHYNKKPMIWKYKTNPFQILSIAIEDSANRYYQIDFEVDIISPINESAEVSANSVCDASDVR